MKLACLTFAVILALLIPVCVYAGDHSPLDAATMKAALHTVTPLEEGFIDRILAKVEKGTLPLDLVESTFLWAKKKPRKQFFYFKKALIIRAADRGINIS